MQRQEDRCTTVISNEGFGHLACTHLFSIGGDINVILKHHWRSFVLLCLLPVSVVAQPGHNFWGKTTPELLKLMEIGDEGVRGSAARFLGMKYQNPMVLSVHEAFYDASKIFPMEELVPSNVVPQLCKSMQTDVAVSVRLAALHSLCDISHRTNTAACIISGLTNSMTLVRLVACESLVRNADAVGSKWPGQIIPTLADCLKSNGNPDELYQVAYTVGCLGSRAEPLLPLLDKFRMHSSKKVRLAVSEASTKIKQSSLTATPSPP